MVPLRASSLAYAPHSLSEGESRPPDRAGREDHSRAPLLREARRDLRPGGDQGSASPSSRACARTARSPAIGESGAHLVTTWELIDDALGREADFSANLTGVLVRGDDGLPTPFEIPGGSADQVIATADEPTHRVHRALVQPRLAAKRIALIEPRIRLWTRNGPWTSGSRPGAAISHPSLRSCPRGPWPSFSGCPKPRTSSASVCGP